MTKRQTVTSHAAAASRDALELAELHGIHRRQAPTYLLRELTRRAVPRARALPPGTSECGRCGKCVHTQMPGCAVHDHRCGGIRLFPHLRRVKKDAAADSFLYTANVARNQRRSRSGVQDIKAACSVGTGSAPETSRRVLRCDSAAAAY